MQEITEEQLRQLRQSAGEDAVNFAYVTEKEWICVCGTHNPLDKTKSIQNCSRCHRNRDSALEHYGRPGEKVQIQISEETLLKNNGGGFFSFRTMISTTLTKIIYVLGMIGITISGIFMVVQAIESRYGSDMQILLGIGLILIGNLLWRIVCEGWILLFSMHDILFSIEKELKRK
jgi:hypothetical protein